MSKATFADFIAQNPNCGKYEGNPVAEAVFELLSRDENIIAMIDSNSAGKPALTPCTHAIEELVGERRDSVVDLNDGFTKQAVGRMVKSVLAPFGYVPDRQKDLPREIQAEYFTSATVYAIDPSVKPSMTVERRVVKL